MLNRDTLEILPEVLVKRIENAGEYAFKKLGEHIDKIGRMTASDVHRIEELRRAGLEAKEIQQYIEKVMQQNIADAFSIYTWTCQENLDKSKNSYAYRGLKNIPYSQNIPFQRIVQSMARRTAGDFLNLSQTTVLNVLKGGKTVSLPFENGYTDIIDQAITNVSLGAEGYQSAIRNVLKTVGEGGLRTVEYESGHTRRLDSAVRMNVLEGIRQVNQGTQDLIGEEIGSDGVEISAHEFCAPDHEPVQGRQMTDKEYEEWNKAHAYPQRQIGKLNCHHYVFRIIIGVDEPAYSEKELSEMAKRNAKGITFEGKHYSMYEATQMQRKLETEIRRQKDVAVLAKSAGNDGLRRSAQAHINLLSNKYKQFSDAAGLEYKAKRMSRADFRRVKTNTELTSSENGSIINTYKGKGLKVESHAFVTEETKQRVIDATKTITSDFKALEQYSEPIVFSSANGAIAINAFDPKTGINQITLNRDSFADTKKLLEVLKKDFDDSVSYDTDMIESLVAHEMGHNAHIALALKRANIKYGRSLTPIQEELFKNELFKITTEIYEAAFADETELEIFSKCATDLGTKSLNANELIAQSFGNYYYGKVKSLIAERIVKYFMKGLK